MTLNKENVITVESINLVHLFTRPPPPLHAVRCQKAEGALL